MGTVHLEFCWFCLSNRIQRKENAVIIGIFTNPIRRCYFPFCFGCLVDSRCRMAGIEKLAEVLVSARKATEDR